MGQAGQRSQTAARTEPVSVHGHPGRWKLPRSAVHVVTAENRHLYRESLEASFRLRHHVYAIERKWHLFRSADGREVDVYDTKDAIYLLALEEPQGRLIGCARLLPTVKAPPLQEFPNLAGGYHLPRSLSVYHFSRCIVAPDRRDGNAHNAVSTLIRVGVQEFCLAENIEQLSILTPVALLPTYLDLGWNPQPLGLPEVLWGTSYAVAMLDISEIALNRTRALYGISDTVLVRRGITRPAVPTACSSQRPC